MYEYFVAPTPNNDSTHWKHTVFYLPHEMSVKQGECITGMLSIKPNDKNHVSYIAA